MTTSSFIGAKVPSCGPSGVAGMAVKFAAACLVLAIALLTSTSQAGDERYSLRSINYQDRFVRHSRGVGELTPIRNGQDEQDAAFIVRKALDGTPGAVSFEAANNSRHFLRHQDFRLKLQHYDGKDRQFREDASFRPTKGLADPQGVSYEAVHFPGHFIRHFDFHLWVNDDRNGQDEKFREDATFYREGPPQLTLSGNSDNERTQVCQSYASLAEAQGSIARARSDHLGTGKGCPGATSQEPMWSPRTSDHFNFCMNDVQADARLLAAQTEARRQSLLACSRQGQIENRNKWPDWDTESSHNYNDLFGSYGLGGDALRSCERDGLRIIESVELIRNDPSLLHDHTRDKGLGHSKEFHHFNHWKSFRCEQRAANVGSSFQLEGYTGQATARGPKSPVSPTFERNGFGVGSNERIGGATQSGTQLGKSGAIDFGGLQGGQKAPPRDFQGQALDLAQVQPGACMSGFVQRAAGPNDLVCVTPAAQKLAAQENGEAAGRVDPNGAYGPNTCLSGYVWRNAFSGDLVCVTPTARDRVAEENRREP